MSTQEAIETPLKPHLAMPKGGLAGRCQRRKKSGEQCAKPARTGYQVCSSHGAGYSTREASGERKKPGRPVEHGIYAAEKARTYGEALEEVASLEDILTNSDRELIALKAVLVMKMRELEDFAPEAARIETTLEKLMTQVQEMLEAPTPQEVMAFVAELADLERPAAKLNRLIGGVTDASTKAIQAHAARAQTTAKLAETEALSVFLQLLQVQRSIFHALAVDDKNLRDSYDMAITREILAPRGLALPPINPEIRV